MSVNPTRCEHAYCYFRSEVRVIHVTSLGFLQFVCGWEDDWHDEYPSVLLRVYWLRTHIFRKEGNNDLAIRALEMVCNLINRHKVVSILTICRYMK